MIAYIGGLGWEHILPLAFLFGGLAVAVFMHQARHLLDVVDANHHHYCVDCDTTNDQDSGVYGCWDAHERVGFFLPCAEHFYLAAEREAKAWVVAATRPAMPYMKEGQG